MKNVLQTVFAVLLLGAVVSQANAADGLYLGAGVGAASVKGDASTATLDADDAAFKGFVGWRFNMLPIIDLAAEAAYTDFGKPTQPSGGGNVSYKLSGASLAGLLIFPLGPLDLYGKAGVISWSSEFNNAGAVTKRSGSDPFYGAGVGVYLWKIGIRAEFERFEIKGVERVDLVSLSALFQF